MSVRNRLDRTDGVATAAPVVLVGVAAALSGYPLPRGGDELLGAGVAGAVLGAVGLVGWRCRATGRHASFGVAVAGVVGAVAWSLVAPGVGAARVGEGVVVTGDPVLARFAGASPLLLIVVGVVAAVEPSLPGPDAVTGGTFDSPGSRSRWAALRRGAAGGLAVAVLGVLPAYLVGAGVDSPTFLGVALGGGFAAATAVGYLLVRHRLLTPVLSLGVVAAAATVTVTAGGSPVGFPTAWVVWFLPGLLAGGVEVLWRWLRGRVR